MLPWTTGENHRIRALEGRLMPLDKSSARVQEMFGEIAGRYDFLNRLLSLGIDRSWRRKTVELVPPEGDEPILDVCTGTADLALAYWRASKGKTPVVGTDFCGPMLAIAREKCRRAVGQVANLSGTANPPAAVPGSETSQTPGIATGWQPVLRCAGITLLQADTLHLPFPDGAFQIVSVAFGLRNVSDTDAGLREMVRVCRPGGRVAVLEFSTPTAWPLGAMYGWYFQHVLPRIGQALARNTQAAYNYLPQSVGRFPQGEALAERMRAAGLGEVWFKRFTFGVATLYSGRKDAP
jgi:demethylmenaquinone methyltransferase / 2-methoxy-6-polyprenyl-1,4-benzoquinol methylase